MAGDPTHPGFTFRIILSGKRSEKTLELRARLMRHKDANLRRWLPKSSSVSAVFVYRNQSTYLRLDRALLMRHKDANLHLAKKCGTGFQKATSQMSLYNYSLSRNIDVLKARQGPAGVPQGCKPALGQEVRHWLLKSSSAS